MTVEEASPGEYDAISPDEWKAIQQRRDEMLDLLNAQVEDYANNMSAPAGEDWFPEQAMLTGDYYIGSESYHRLPGEDWVQICLEARCLGHGSAGPEDYLGLHVWLRYDPAEGRLWSHRNADSMVI